MRKLLRSEGVPRKGIVGALDNLKPAIAGEDPEVALFVADAAIAFEGRLDLRELHLVHKGFAVAIASVHTQLWLVLCVRVPDGHCWQGLLLLLGNSSALGWLRVLLAIAPLWRRRLLSAFHAPCRNHAGQFQLALVSASVVAFSGVWRQRETQNNCKRGELDVPGGARRASTSPCVAQTLLARAARQSQSPHSVRHREPGTCMRWLDARCEVTSSLCHAAGQRECGEGALYSGDSPNARLPRAPEAWCNGPPTDRSFFGGRPPGVQCVKASGSLSKSLSMSGTDTAHATQDILATQWYSGHFSACGGHWYRSPSLSSLIREQSTKQRWRVWSVA